MFKSISAAAAMVVALAAPAFAWEGQVVACYDKVFVPAQFSTTKHLHSKAYTKWEHRGHQLVEVYYPAMYIEKRTKTADAHYIKRKAPCRASK
ncbi:MAG: hypothetical protein ACU0DW_08675 [Shimia sp.]